MIIFVKTLRFSMEDIFNEQRPRGIKEWLIAHQVGLLGTVIFHLVILILVLIMKLNPVKPSNDMVYMELQPIQQQIQPNPQKLADEILKKEEPKTEEAAKGNSASTVRNVAVNSNLNKLTDKLVDDKFGKANPVYDEARKLEEKMRANRELYKKSLEASKAPEQQSGSQTSSRASSEKAYRGASVLAYSLGGRQGVELPVPAYLCEGGGDVVVDIVVNQRGAVTSSSISSQTKASECLFAEALKAARRSRFTVKADAPSAQKGSITYRFVAQ